MGMGSFFDDKKNKTKPKYYEVPIEIVEDRDELAKWATTAYEIAKKLKK